MQNLNKNQHPTPPFADFLRKFSLWLYTHADTLAIYGKNILDVILLFTGLYLCYLGLLIGGAM